MVSALYVQGPACLTGQRWPPSSSQQLFPREVWAHLRVIPGRGRCSSTQIKAMLGVTSKWTQGYSGSVPLSESNQVKLSMRRSSAHGWGGVQMKTRFRRRLTWESPGALFKRERGKREREKGIRVFSHPQTLLTFKYFASSLVPFSSSLFVSFSKGRAEWALWHECAWALGGLPAWWEW